MTNTLRSLVTAGILGVAVAGCNLPQFPIYGNLTTKEGYKVSGTEDGMGRHLVIEDSYLTSSAKGLLGHDFLTVWDRDNDGRFDEINLSYLPKGHPIEAYATLNKLDSLWKRLPVRRRINEYKTIK